MLPSNFKGRSYRLTHNWKDIIKVIDKPINYLEIGVMCGANVLSFEKLYGSHPDTKITCIDPWEDYSEYSEYKNEGSFNYNCFCFNTENIKHKINVIRGLSFNECYKLPNEYYDIIYIDGNHLANAVLEDGVNSFRKLKKGGFMIFDDYGWGGADLTKRGIDAFINAYRDLIKVPIEFNGQMFLQKIL